LSAEVKQRPTFRRWLMVLAVLAAIAGTAALVQARSSTAPPSKVEIGGTFTLKSVRGINHGPALNGGCFGMNGYSDIQPGTQVRVKDATGKVVGVGALEGGTYLEDSFSCRFDFVVTVPDSDYYQVAVSHRGDVAADRSTAQAKAIALTLG
jgi:hypothetical protein